MTSISSFSQRLPFLSKIFVSCQRTLSNRANAIALGSIAVGAVLSPSFQLGLITSPIGMASSLSILILANSAVGKRIFSKIPKLPSKIECLANKVSKILPRIFPESSLTTSVVMPIIEEAIFRGAIQSASVAILGTMPGIALSALAFSAAHIDPRQPHQVVNSFLGGIVLGALKEKFSILASIGHHVGVNTFWGPILGLGPDKGFVRNYLEASTNNSG